MRSIEVLALIAFQSALALGRCSTFVPAAMDSERQISAAEVFGYSKGEKKYGSYSDSAKKSCSKKFIDEQLVQAKNLQKFAWDFGTGKAAHAFYNVAFEAWKKFIKNTAKEPCDCDCDDCHDDHDDCHDNHDDCHDDHDDCHDDHDDCDDHKHCKYVAKIVDNNDLKFTCGNFKLTTDVKKHFPLPG